MTEENAAPVPDEDRDSIHRVHGVRKSKKPFYVLSIDTRRELDHFYVSHPVRHVARRCADLAAREPAGDADATQLADYVLDTRGLYLGALESLLAAWAAHAEVPEFPPAWLQLYQLGDLRAFVESLVEDARAHIVGIKEPWRSRTVALFPLLRRHAEHDAEVDALSRCVVVWGGDFLHDQGSEWNGIKHGLRVRAGQFAITMQSEADPSSKFSLAAPAGTHVPYLKPLEVPGFEKRAYLFATKSIGIDPRRDLSRLNLLCRATKNLLTQAHLMSQKEGSCEYEAIASPDLDRQLFESRGDMVGSEMTPVILVDEMKRVLDEWENAPGAAPEQPTGSAAVPPTDEPA